MIRIDLMPGDLRRNERTAPAVFFAAVGLVVFFCLSAVGVAYAWFGVVGKARGDVQIAQEEFDGKKPRADYSDQLDAEKKIYTARLDQIKEFSDSRVLWTKKFDQLWSLVDSPAEEGRHKVWFDQIVVDMESARTPGLNLKGKSETSQGRKFSNFHKDLQSGEFAKEFESITDPVFNVVEDDEFDPSEACEFDLTIGLKDKSKDGKKKPAAAAKKAAAPAKSGK